MINAKTNLARWGALVKASRQTGREIAPEWRSRMLFMQCMEEEERLIRTVYGNKGLLFFTTKFAEFDPMDVPLGPENCGLVSETIAHQIRATTNKTKLPAGVSRDYRYQSKPYQGLVVNGKIKYREWFATVQEAHQYWQRKKVSVLEAQMHKLKYDGWVPLFEKVIARIQEDLRLNRETKLSGLK